MIRSAEPHSGFAHAALLWVVVATLLLAGTFAVSQVTSYVAESNLERRAVQRLSLYRNSLLGQLERFDYLPYILSKDSELHGLLRDGGELQRDKTNRFLERVNQEAGAAAVFLMNAAGTTVASSKQLALSAEFRGTFLPLPALFSTGT